MGVMQAVAMPQDILPAIPAPARAGEMGASEAGSFRKVLQQRQASSATAPDQADKHAASSPRVVTARRQSVPRKPESDQRDAGAKGDGNKVRNSRAEGSLSEDGLPQCEGSGEAADEAAADEVKEVTEAPVAVAGNAVVFAADATTIAKDIAEQGSNQGSAGEAATVAVGSAGADIEAGTALDAGAGAAGIGGIVNDGAATVAVTGGANAAGKAGEAAVKAAVTVADEPAEHGMPKKEGMDPATEARNDTGTVASEKRQPEVPGLRKVSREGATGTDEASARLDAAAGLAAVDSNVTDEAAKQNRDDAAQVGPAIPEQSEAGQQVRQQEGIDGKSATTTSQEPASAADLQREPAGVPVQESAAKAERKEARIEAEHRLHPPAEAVEQVAAGAGRKVETTEAGKTASVAEAQGATPQAKGGDSGTAAGKGGEEQQQGKRAEQLAAPPLGAELRAPDAPPDAFRNEAEKTALHKSILSQVRDGAVTHDSKGNGQMNIRLNPAELGELNIQVRMEDGRVRVDVQADNRMVKDLLMSDLDTLKEALAGRNFTMEGFEVSTGGGFNNAHPDQRANPQQRSVRRIPGSGYREDGGSGGRVNYLTADVNNLLDVRF